METTIEIIIEGRPVVFWNKLILYIDQQYHFGGDSEFMQKLYDVYHGPTNNRRMYYPRLLVPGKPEEITRSTTQILLSVDIPTIINLDYSEGYDCLIRALLISDTRTHITFKTYFCSQLLLCDKGASLGNVRGKVFGIVSTIKAGANTIVMFIDEDIAFKVPIPETGVALFAEFVRKAIDHFKKLGVMVSVDTNTGTAGGGVTSDITADVAILTILPEEYQAVCSKIKNLQPALLRSDHPNLYAWKVGTVTSGAGAYSVAVGMLGRSGTNESALATADAIERWSPRFIFFMGVAGGLKNTNKGDVVIADVLHGYEYGKIEERFVPRGNWTYKTDIGLLNGAVAHSAADWKVLIQVEPPVECRIKVSSGEIALGDKVVDDPGNQFFAEVIDAWPKIKAVEMEGAGAGNAIEHAQSLGKSVSFMMIRGISDLPRPPEPRQGEDKPRGTEERDVWKAYAADTAAAFTISFIANGLPLPPR